MENDKHKNWHECFNVGFSVCGGSYDSFVDNVHGINAILVKNMGATMLSDFDKYCNNRKEHAYKLFCKELELELSKKKKFNHTITRINRFNVSKERNVFSKGKNWGYVLVVPDGEYLELRLESIGIYVHKPGKIRIKVLDLDRSIELFSGDYEVSRSTSEVFINEIVSSAVSNTFFIGLDILGDTVLFEMDCMGFDSCCKCMCDVEEVFGFIPCDMAYTYDNINWQEKKAFCYKANIGCNFNKIVCSYSNLLLDAFTHRLAIVFLNDKISGYGKSYFESSNVNLNAEITLPSVQKEYKTMIDLCTDTIYREIGNTICFDCDSISTMHPQKSSYS